MGKSRHLRKRMQAQALLFISCSVYCNSLNDALLTAPLFDGVDLVPRLTSLWRSRPFRRSLVFVTMTLISRSPFPLSSLLPCRKIPPGHCPEGEQWRRGRSFLRGAGISHPRGRHRGDNQVRDSGWIRPLQWVVPSCNIYTFERLCSWASLEIFRDAKLNLPFVSPLSW